MKAPTHVRTILAVAVLVVALVAALPTGGAPVADAPGNETNVSNVSNVSSGEALSGAVAVHAADLDGDVEQRAFSRELSTAGDDRARAALLSERRVDAERRVERLADRREGLRERRRSGNLSVSAYRVRSAAISAEARQVRAILVTVANESRTLPDSLRETYGLDASSLNRSLARYDATADAEFDATLAAMTGEPLGRDGDADPANYTAASVRNETAEAVERTRTEHRDLASRFERLADEGADPAVLACGAENLTRADAALQRAEAALAAGHSATTEAALVDARTGLERARSCLERRSRDGDGTDGGTESGSDDSTGSGSPGDGFDDGGFDDPDAGWNESHLNDSDTSWNDNDFERDSGA